MEVRDTSTKMPPKLMQGAWSNQNTEPKPEG